MGEGFSHRLHPRVQERIRGGEVALSLSSISCKAQLKAPRMLVLGVEKIGKTCFAAGCTFEGGQLVAQGVNSPVILPMKGEEGIDDLEVSAFPTLTTYEDVLDALGVLYTEHHEYKTVVLDSASAFEPLVWDHLCKTNSVDSIDKVMGGYGKGYGESANLFRRLTDALDALRQERNMASVIVGHVKVRRFDDPGGDSYDQYQFDIHEKSANLLMRWADLILFCNNKVAVKREDVGFRKEKKRGIDVGGGNRFLYTKKSPAHPGGGRGVYGRLPHEMPLSWGAFETAVSNAIAGGKSVG